MGKRSEHKGDYDDVWEYERCVSSFDALTKGDDPIRWT